MMATTARLVSPESQFPGKLHSLIEYAENRGIEKTTISWVRNGTAIMIHKPSKLLEILPLFFDLTKYQSFKRQLKMWHFTRIDGEHYEGCFEHPYFQRGKRELCALMSRKYPPPAETEEVESPLSSLNSSHQETRMEISRSNQTLPSLFDHSSRTAAGAFLQHLDTEQKEPKAQDVSATTTSKSGQPGTEAQKKVSSVGVDGMMDTQTSLRNNVAQQCGGASDLRQIQEYQVADDHKSNCRNMVTDENLESSSSSVLIDNLVEPVADILDSIFEG